MMIVANRPSNRVRRAFASSSWRRGDALTALAERTAEVDRLVMDAAERLLFPASRPTCRACRGRLRPAAAFPYSDIDVLLLFPSERHIAGAKESISAFLQHLWDAGLRMSHSVRTPDECAEVHDSNTELNISLLDQRFLTGDRTLYAGLGRPPAALHPRQSRCAGTQSRAADARSSRQIRRHVLSPGAERQGHSRRPARLPAGLLARTTARWRCRSRSANCARRIISWPACAAICRYRAAATTTCSTFDAQDALAEHWQLPDAAQWMREYYRHSRSKQYVL